MSENIPPVEPVQEPKKNKTLIIIIVAVVLVCCCCTAIGVLGWNFGDQLLSQLGVY
ncbi:MAG: hypothetical protein JXA13_07490 [Anaerolineales bacterium]|nr:hypothetical protein [Anaerolineales bacterium]